MVSISAPAQPAAAIGLLEKVREAQPASHLAALIGVQDRRKLTSRVSRRSNSDVSPSGEDALSGERVERRLTAILAADVAGYSRLMGEDEAGTLTRLKTLRRELIDPKIAEHNGRIVKTTGDR